ncbi:MAG: MGH1-like glycoside hydrolase domain-containing protein [Bacteroidota bacterium]
MVVRFQLFTLILFLSSCTSNNPSLSKIGNFYPDVAHGITFLYENNQAFLFRIGFQDSLDNYIATYNEHKDILKDESGQLFGSSAPDYSYNKYGFTTDKGNKVWIEWSRTEDGLNAVGKIYSDNPQEIFIEAMQSFPESDEVYYSIEGNMTKGWLKSPAISEGPDWFFVTLDRDYSRAYASMNPDESIEQKIKQNEEIQAAKTASAIATAYLVSAEDPIYFNTGTNTKNYSVGNIEKRLQQTLAFYNANRFKVTTPFGEIWEAVSNHLNHSRVYGTQTRLTAHVVSRGWCSGVNQRIFEWDTFFHALLASLEDPEGGKESVRAILAHQTPEGIVPNNNYGNDTVNNSNDRSQPPVGAICVWKMYQYHPDTEFLKEVYPKLLKWHNWWFDIRPENGLPYRDGNNNGLLEWGTEIDTWLQGAKYESGQDNSPMFDDARMNETSRTMELDMAGLSGLWAADALFLSYIADAIDKKDDAEELRNQAVEMNRRINEVLWNEEVGMYCNKYWDEYSRKPRVESFKSIPENVLSERTTYTYKQENGEEIKKSTRKVGLDARQLKSTGLAERQYSKYAREDNPTKFEFTITPEKSGVYFFYTPEEFGVELIVDGKNLIDNRLMWITEFISNPIHLEAGHEYRAELNYTGDIPFELKWVMAQKFEGSLFSERMGPTLFYPLIAGAPNKVKAERIIANLLDTSLFWGNFVIPTISRNDPAFPTQGYWRGRIWPPTNYLTYLGIKKYAPENVTWDFAVKSATQAQNEWLTRGQLYENYYADGPGAGDPHYCWGGLMQYILVEEIAGLDKNNQIRRNKFAGPDYILENFPVNRHETQ